MITKLFPLLTTPEQVPAEIARVSANLNQHLQNIGARRLNTVLEKVMEEISYEVPDMSPKDRSVVWTGPSVSASVCWIFRGVILYTRRHTTHGRRVIARLHVCCSVHIALYIFLFVQIVEQSRIAEAVKDMNKKTDLRRYTL